VIVAGSSMWKIRLRSGRDDKFVRQTNWQLCACVIVENDPFKGWFWLVGQKDV
jgi:hypothetical protein